ncbi:DUF2884 family protein [Dyella sp.]|uniref:DUF2884 family protein n=1 Tax=Dyella sp. TaxID=1869338 RepID=UPI002ED3A8E1
MSKKTAGWVAALALVLAADASAMDIHFDNDGCGYSTDYDVHIRANGIAFDREKGTPQHVFMHGGAIDVDGRPIAVSSDDAVRLQQFEGQVRGLLPEVTSIARESLDIGFGALTTVAATFSEDPGERKAMLDKINAKRAQALAEIDKGMAQGVWRHDDMERSVEDGITTAVSELVSSVTGSAVSAALSGDQAKVEALEARADSLDKSINKEVDARAEQLGKRAQALCPRVQQLDQLQKQFAFRLNDGSSLNLLTADEGKHKVVASF